MALAVLRCIEFLLVDVNVVRRDRRGGEARLEMGAHERGKGWKWGSNLFPVERYSLAMTTRSGEQCAHGIASSGGPHREPVTDERALVERFLRGRSEAAFRALYRAHTPALYALALRLTGGDRGEAEDLVQESWVRALTALRTFRGQSALRSWLCGVLVNVRRGRIRAEWRIVDTPDAEPIAERTDPDDVIDLERGIAELPDGARDVYVLHDVYGYTHREIAELLGVMEGTSKSQLNRARFLLRLSLL
jgi:RNA polymerase sigma-70 factor (ECF subfamily)